MGQLLDSANIAPGQALPGSLKATLLTAQAPPVPRKVCIAFEHVESGNNMISWAAKHCLFPDDDVHLVHMTNRVSLIGIWAEAPCKPIYYEDGKHYWQTWCSNA